MTQGLVQNKKPLKMVDFQRLLYSGRDLNPHGHYCPLDFKSNVSTNSTTRAPFGLFTKKKSERRDSNPRHPPWQGGALPAELLSLIHCECKDKIFFSFTKIFFRKNLKNFILLLHLIPLSNFQ